MKTERETIFSPCRKYRYTLWRDWMDDVMELEEHRNNKTAMYVQFIGLNPSTADETLDDPTIRRCIDFAKRWGFGAMCMTNLFAFRATDPDVMKAAKLPIGEASFCAYNVGNMAFAERNDAHIYGVANGAGLIVAAWGNDGSHLGRSSYVLDMLKRHKFSPHHLGLTQSGEPKHPLYLRSDTKPVPFK